MTAAPIREAMWLVRGGVPFDVAFSMEETMRAGLCIILSEQEGREFSFATMTFKDDE